MAYTSSYIIDWIQADRELAFRLDKALKGVKEGMIEKGEQLNNAFRRATWYSSCFTQNYQDVCQNLKNEDLRFVKGLVQLIKRQNIITDMIELYVKNYLSSFTDDKITKISRELARMTAHSATGVFTTKSIVYAVTRAVAGSDAIGSFLNRERVSSFATYPLWLLTGYSYVDKAAQKANELKSFNSFYYSVLYGQDLEMMYFIVEPVLSRNNNFNTIMKSPRELAEGLYRLMR